jgi:hypothetical protein
MSVKPLPPNFKTIILDWTKDLSITFPEYAYLWSKWTNPDMTELEVRQLYDYCLTVYPERFFDILYQSTELFDLFSTVNTCFLPGVEFKLLFNCPDVSENTTKTMWKYLQLVLFTVAGSIHDKSNFGESANLFEGLDEDELHTKLQDAITNMGDFFQNMSDQAPNQSSDQHQEQSTGQDNDKSTSQSLPDVDELHGHIKGLFDGKIGSLAKELAEEISGDMADILGKDCENMKSTADVLKNMMKNPTKITGLIKTVSDKLQQKMNSGEISQDELMKEATDIIGKMKGMGGGGKGMGNGMGGGPMDGMGDFQEMFKNMAKGMGMNIPKNAKMDTNALDRMTQASTMKDRLRNKMANKKAKEEAAALEKAATLAEQAKNYKPFDFSDEKPSKPTKSVFKIEGDTVQQTSSIIRPPLVTVNSDLDSSSLDLGASTDSTNKKKKKKGKK